MIIIIVHLAHAPREEKSSKTHFDMNSSNKIDKTGGSLAWETEEDEYRIRKDVNTNPFTRPLRPEQLN